MLPKRPIAIGRTSEIYAWKDGTVLKLFHDWFPREAVAYEARITRAVHSSGLAVPRVGDVVEVDGRVGLELERVDGISLLAEMGARPWALGKYAGLLASLHAEVHAIADLPGLPTLKTRLEARIRQSDELSSETREACLAALAAMPGGRRLCHGDFHPGNVILTTQGPVIIDWIDAAIGSPLADVARTTVLALGEKATARPTALLEKAMLGWGHSLYRKRYFQLRPGGEEEYRAWLPLVAAARLSEGIEELAPWLRSQADTVLRGTRL